MQTIPGIKPRPRRLFLKHMVAFVIGTMSGLIPAGIGLITFCDPLFQRKRTSSRYVRVTPLVALPNNSIPRKFVVIATQTDAWNKLPAVPIGAVYLRRIGPSTVQGFNAACPHAGCFVDFLPEELDYRCPCHGSSFALDGQIKDPKSPSPRGLDALGVEIRNDEVWVDFQNFVAGRREKTPVA